MRKAVVLVMSDSSSRGEREDASGKLLMKLLEKDFETKLEIIPDEKEKITGRIIYYSDKEQADLILTTGGTGLGPRDVTPEATLDVSERIVPGLSELIREKGAKKTSRAYLSRGVSVLRGRTLIINLPGSPGGASESYLAVKELLPHAFEMIEGKGHGKENRK
ncbi:MAG TPA: MogA/MoaB family molybdenum cofactor biosynthesis protein [bacterium]|nr:MogA/MoaB family molybdenum cofactor biosynthesis protein [bacterium]